MEFRRSGQRAGRRRRVLLDERTTGPAGSPEGGASAQELSGASEAGAAKTYVDDALASRQRRVTDLIPTRPWTLAVLALTGLTLIAGLEAIYVRLPSSGLAARWPALLPYTNSSLAAWFSAWLFFVASAASVLIYSLRRHKVDDYRGRYRMWLWVSALAALASINAVTGLMQTLTAWVAELTRWPSIEMAGVFWQFVATGLLAVIAVRLLVEMRQSWAAVATWLAACSSCLVAAYLRPEMMVGGNLKLTLLATSTATLLGHFGIVYSLALYARFVYLDAQGQLKPRRIAASKARPAESNGDSEDSSRSRRSRGKQVRVDQAHTDKPAPSSQQRASRKKTARTTAAASSAAARSQAKPADSSETGSGRQATAAGSAEGRETAAIDESADPDLWQGLSKAERKRLRRKLRKQRSGQG